MEEEDGVLQRREVVPPKVETRSDFPEGVPDVLFVVLVHLLQNARA